MMSECMGVAGTGSVWDTQRGGGSSDSGMDHSQEGKEGQCEGSGKLIIVGLFLKESMVTACLGRNTRRFCVCVCVCLCVCVSACASGSEPVVTEHIHAFFSFSLCVCVCCCGLLLLFFFFVCVFFWGETTCQLDFSHLS